MVTDPPLVRCCFTIVSGQCFLFDRSIKYVSLKILIIYSFSYYLTVVSIFSTIFMGIDLGYLDVVEDTVNLCDSESRRQMISPRWNWYLP